ncbi:putative hydro-lyase [Bhargavaea ginsengi]|uniref:putative hydro-lyase n=1 Tax=Bhargavaea ginsengi TaxID=426757 RepID=UPI003C74376C
MRNMTPEQFREQVRNGVYTGPTAGVCDGYVQANLAILPKEDAFEFLLFCQRNPKSCPLIDVTDIGSAIPAASAPGADLRTDLPKYRVYRSGELVDEPTDLNDYWKEDMVAFLIGCSFTFEEALIRNGIPMRHHEEGVNVPMYRTSVDTVPAGKFSGPMVVSMRPMGAGDVVRAVQVTSRFPSVHGAPVHIGKPEEIGIRNLAEPDFGDAVTVRKGETPVFWACGVTPQSVAMHAKPSLMITHAPGHMFVTDLKSEQLGVI